MPKYDVIIKSHPKDYNKLKFIIPSLKYLHPQPEGVYLINPTGFVPDEYKQETWIHLFKDDEVLPPIDKYRIKHRAGWAYQMMIALFQQVTENDLYLDVLGDNFFVGDINLFSEEGKPIFFQSPQRKQYHWPVFAFNKKVYGLHGRPNEEFHLEKQDSFIVEFMMYNRKISKELLDVFGGFHGFFDKCVDVIEFTCQLSDPELYADWVLTHHPGEYILKMDVPLWIDAVEDPLTFTDEMLEERIKAHTGIGLIAISCHTWKNER